MIKYPPSAKVALRLEREAIQQIADQRQVAYDAMETAYGKARTSVAHLYHHAHEPVHKSDEGLIQQSRDLLARVDKLLVDTKDTYGTKQWRESVSAQAAKVRALLDKDPVYRTVDPKDIETFLAVVEAARELYEAKGYDFTGFINPQLYALAGMIAENFSAYEKTLAHG